jgi:hypothetical protein
MSNQGWIQEIRDVVDYIYCNDDESKLIYNDVKKKILDEADSTSNSFEFNLYNILFKIHTHYYIIITKYYKENIRNKNTNKFFENYEVYRKSLSNYKTNINKINSYNCVRFYILIKKDIKFLKQIVGENSELQSGLDKNIHDITIIFEKFVGMYISLEKNIQFKNNHLTYKRSSTLSKNSQEYKNMLKDIFDNLRNVVKNQWEMEFPYESSDKETIKKILTEAFFLRKESKIYRQIKNLLNLQPGPDKEDIIEWIKKNKIEELNTYLQSVYKTLIRSKIDDIDMDIYSLYSLLYKKLYKGNKNNNQKTLKERIKEVLFSRDVIREFKLFVLSNYAEQIKIQYVISHNNQPGIIVSYKGDNIDSKKEGFIDSFLKFLISINQYIRFISEEVRENETEMYPSNVVNNNNKIIKTLHLLGLDEILAQYKETKQILSLLNLSEGNEIYDKCIELYSVFNIFKSNYTDSDQETMTELKKIVDSLKNPEIYVYENGEETEMNKETDCKEILSDIQGRIKKIIKSRMRENANNRENYNEHFKDLNKNWKNAKIEDCFNEFNTILMGIPFLMKEDKKLIKKYCLSIWKWLSFQFRLFVTHFDIQQIIDSIDLENSSCNYEIKIFYTTTGKDENKKCTTIIDLLDNIYDRLYSILKKESRFTLGLTSNDSDNHSGLNNIKRIFYNNSEKKRKNKNESIRSRFSENTEYKDVQVRLYKIRSILETGFSLPYDNELYKNLMNKINTLLSRDSAKQIAENIKPIPEQKLIEYKSIPIRAVNIKSNFSQITDKNLEIYIKTDTKLFGFLHDVYKRLQALLPEKKRNSIHPIQWNKTQNGIKKMFQSSKSSAQVEFQKENLYSEYKKEFDSLFQNLKDTASEENKTYIEEIQNRIDHIIPSPKYNKYNM